MNHIDTLKNIKAGFEKDEWMADDVEALDCAIKALKNQKSIIEELEKIKKDIDKWRHVRNCSCSDCMDIIDMRIYELKGEAE